MSVSLKRFTSFDYGQGLGYLEVWINPAVVTHVAPRKSYDSKADRHALTGTRIFHGDCSVDVKEPIGQVVALLNSSGGVCRDCYQELPESWRQLCDDCRVRHNGVHVDPEEAAVR